MPKCMQTNDNVFGERLKKIRLQHNESQEELAKVLNTDRTTIFRYENGKTPQVPILKKIAVHYNISLDYLCGLIDTAVVLDKVEKYNSISKCVSRAKTLLDNIEIQYKNELEKLNNNKKD